MKLKYIFASIVATLALAVGCQKEADHYLKEVQVSSSYLAFPAEGGSVDVTVTATQEWSINTIPEWINATPAYGSAGVTTVKFTAIAATETREADFSITSGTVNQTIKARQVTEAVEPETISVAAALALIKAVDKGDGGNYNVSGTYRIKGVVCKISSIDVSYGNATYYISDDGKFDSNTALQVYRGLWLEGSAFTKGDEFAVGDELTIEGQLMSYKGTPETAEKTAYVVSIEKSLIGIESVELLNVEEGKGITQFPKDGGAIKVTLTLKSKEFHVEIPAAAKSWLTIEDFGAKYVTLAAAPNEGGDRDVTVTFTTNDGAKDYSCEQAFTQKGAVIAASVAEFLAAEVGTVQYRLSGVITSEYTSDKQGQSFYLRDATGEVLVYRLNDYKASGAKVLDVITVVGQRGAYKETAQMVNGVYESHVAVSTVSVAEFLAAEVSTTALYCLKGTITSEYASDKQGQSFYMKDDSGEVLIYRLGDYKASGAKIGDVITVVGQRGAYKDTPQMVSGLYVTHESAGEGGGEGGGEEGTVDTEFSSNVSWGDLNNAVGDGAATVNGVADVTTLKIGSSKANGSASITVPAGTKELSFYCVGWKGSTDTKVVIKNGESVVLEQAVAANDGATANPPYTMTVTASDKYVVKFESALSAETKLTVENSGARVVLFRVQSSK